MSRYTYIPPLPHTYSRIFHPLEKYLSMLNRGCRGKSFLMGDRKHRDDPKTYNEMMLDIDSKKGCELTFLTRYLLRISIWSSLWFSLLVIGDHKVCNNLGVGTFILVI